MVKEANSKLSALQEELQELDSQILLSQGQAGAPTEPPPFTNNLGKSLVLSTSLSLYDIVAEA